MDGGGEGEERWLRESEPFGADGCAAAIAALRVDKTTGEDMYRSTRQRANWK